IQSDWQGAKIPWQLVTTRRLIPEGVEIAAGGGFMRANLRGTALGDLPTVGGAAYTRQSRSGWNAGLAARAPMRYRLSGQLEVDEVARGFDVSIPVTAAGEYREKYRESAIQTTLLIKKRGMLPWNASIWPEVGF